MFFELSRLCAAEADQYVKRDPHNSKRVTGVIDPTEHQRLTSLSDTLENVGLALVKWGQAHVR